MYTKAYLENWMLSSSSLYSQQDLLKSHLELYTECDKLREEITKLRPAPRFHVGQVVRFNNGYHKIVAMQWNATAPYKCEYDIGDYWVFESNLAALTDLERKL